MSSDLICIGIIMSNFTQEQIEGIAIANLKQVRIRINITDEPWLQLYTYDSNYAADLKAIGLKEINLDDPSQNDGFLIPRKGEHKTTCISILGSAVRQYAEKIPFEGRELLFPDLKPSIPSKVRL